MSQSYETMSDHDLEVASFGEGILRDEKTPSEGVPPSGTRGEEECEQSITVYMDEEKTQTPVGSIMNAPFLELFWRKTGADCDNEEDEMKFPNGKTYRVILKESSVNE